MASEHDDGLPRPTGEAPTGAPGVPEPLPPGCMGLIFAGIVAGAICLLLYAWMSASTHTGTFATAYGSAIGGAAIIGLGIIIVPIASLVAFFFGRALGHRRKMYADMERLTTDEPSTLTPRDQPPPP